MGEQVAGRRRRCGAGRGHERRGASADDARRPPRIIRRMHPTALLEAADRARASRVARSSSRPIASSPTSFASSARSASRDRHVLTDGVFAPAAPAAACGATRELGQRRPRRDRRGVWRSCPGRATPACLRAALDDRERAWLERCQAFDLEALPERLRHNLPDWLAAAAAGAARRRVLALGRGDRRAGAARPARQRAQGGPRRDPRSPARRGHRRRADAVLAARPARRRQAGAAEASTSSRTAWSRRRTKAASCSR